MFFNGKELMLSIVNEQVNRSMCKHQYEKKVSLKNDIYEECKKCGHCREIKKRRDK